MTTQIILNIKKRLPKKHKRLYYKMFKETYKYDEHYENLQAK